jgi:hypothetical protein
MSKNRKGNMENNKPNFFIVGAARSGTTSIWEYLKRNPQVYMPEELLLKEPAYFSDGGRFRVKGMYLKLFEAANKNHKIIGEASVAYLTDPKSASRIFTFNPCAKIIIMLRNPADRAFSLYNWMIQEGYEYASSFIDALNLEGSRVFEKKKNWYKPNYYWGYLYFRSGLYNNQVKKYYEFFKNNLLIIKFEDFINNPTLIYKNICSFLNIEPIPFDFQVHNPSLRVISSNILFILRKLNNFIISQNKKGIPMKDISKNIINEYNQIQLKLSRVSKMGLSERIKGKRVLKKVQKHLEKLEDQYIFRNIKSKEQRDLVMSFGQKKERAAKLNGSIRKKLLRQYEPDIIMLSDLTGIGFSDWLQGI